ncbi:MAG TPA: hypothetical protein VFC00_28860 [Micromonosporaceae bacterium]|nr:hypothetical protein [Micromonosporaceae bacterium]
MRRVLAAVGSSTGVLSAVFVAGWTGVVLILAVVLVLTGAMCWVLADAERPARLAMLLSAWRASAPPKAFRHSRLRTHKRRTPLLDDDHGHDEGKP